jgi:hypothetical protein
MVCLKQGEKVGNWNRIEERRRMPHCSIVGSILFGTINNPQPE